METILVHRFKSLGPWLTDIINFRSLRHEYLGKYIEGESVLPPDSQGIKRGKWTKENISDEVMLS